MSPKVIVMMGGFLGGLVGGYITILLGAPFISYWSLIGNTIGGLMGIWISYQLISQM